MKYFSSFYAGLLVFLFLPSTILAVQTSTRTETKTVEVSLSSNSKQPMSTIDLEQYNIAMPAECALANVSCIESTQIKMTITKNWEITTVYPLEDERLKPEEYALYYPNMSDENPIKKNSEPDQVKLLQRALYERGILGTLPTGRYGALTELAVLHFQQIKGLDTCSDGPIIADATTINELNSMKNRMADASYTIVTSAPAFKASELCDDQAVRFNELVHFVDAASQGKIIQTLQPIDSNQVEIRIEGVKPNRGAINVDGFIKIER